MTGVNRPAIAFGVSLSVLFLLSAGVELGFRALAPAEARQPILNLRHYLLSGQPRGYEPRAYTVYQEPRMSGFGNAFGFSDLPWTRARTRGVPRIICLGGSTTGLASEGARPSDRKQ